MGLEVWLCPFTNGLTQGELLDLLADCAEHAERLRRDGADVVMLTGSELSLFTVGFLPGETLAERLALVADPLRVRPVIGEVRARMNAFLRRAVDVVRARFGGPVSYASLPLEGVDRTPFDIIATDAAYRSAVTAANFRDAEFVYTFARYDLPHRDDPGADLDVVSCGVVKVLEGQSGARGPSGRRYPDMPWEPKAAFDAVADRYGR